MSRRRRQGSCQARRQILTPQDFPKYRELMLYFYARAATRYLRNKEVDRLSPGDLVYIVQYLDGEIKSGRGNYVPLLLTLHDRRMYFTLHEARDFLNNAVNNIYLNLSLPPALSFEYGEYLRTYSDFVKGRLLKRKSLCVRSDLLALAVVGAYLTEYYYKQERNKHSRYYMFLDVLGLPFSTATGLLNDARKLAKAVRLGDGSPLTLYVGIAALVATRSRLRKRMLRRGGRVILYHVAVEGEERAELRGIPKVRLASFDQRDLTELMIDIEHLMLGNPLRRLIARYPKAGTASTSEERALRSFIENLSRSVYIYHAHRNYEELYKCLRVLSSEEFNNKMKSLLGEATWNNIRNGLLSLKL